MKTVAECKFFVIMHGESRHNGFLEYYVTSRRSSMPIATIAWHAPWKRFCFYPRMLTTWSADCLADVQEFLEKINSEKVKEMKGG